MHWSTLVLIICLIVALFAVAKEYRRGNKQRLVLRIAASLTSIAALAAIALPLTYTSALNKPVNEAVLLTTGFNQDSLIKYNFDTIYTIDVEIKNQYPKAKLVTAYQLKGVNPAISRLHLLGYGLPEDELKQLDNIPIIFYPEPIPKGIIAASWPAELKQGEPLTLQGKYHNTGNSGVRLVLKELNTTIDSVIIKNPGNEDFELTSVPKSTGRLTDRLIVLQDNDTLENENVPLIIEPVHPLKVLMLGASPSFENKFLKNWLVEKNFGVAVRSAISKGKFSTAFTNLQQIPLTHLSADVLDKFDVLIADRLALRTLSAADQTALKHEINENGLGLIIRADTVFKAGALFQADFPVYKSAENNPKPLAIQFQGAKSALKALNGGQLFIRDKADMQALAYDVQKRLLAAVSLAGTGKVVCTTMDNTYSWMLAGNKDDYAAFWSLLIGKAAKTPPQNENWNIRNPYPAVHVPETLQLETAQQPGQLIVDNESTSPVQNEMLPFQWQSTFWADKTGWLSIHHTGGPAAWLYFYNPADWATIKAVRTIAATKKYALDTKTSDVTKQIQHKVKILMPKVYFYMLLLLCCTFLWVEGKLPSGILT